MFVYFDYQGLRSQVRIVADQKRILKNLEEC